MVIKFRGKTYELIESEFSNEGEMFNMLNNTIGFQHRQLQYCIETRDYVTLNNRIINGLTHGWLKEI